jgi:hypothetical protein
MSSSNVPSVLDVGTYDLEIDGSTVGVSRKKSRPSSENHYVTTGTAVEEKLRTTTWVCNNIDHPRFSSLFQHYLETLNDKSGKKVGNRVIRAEMKTNADEMNDGLSRVKKHVGCIVGQTAGYEAYASLGIQHYDKGYVFRDTPADKIADVDLFIRHYANSQYITDMYPVAYFETRLARYKELFNSLISDTGKVSEKVGEKQDLTRELNRAFNSVLALIKCNVPQEQHAAYIRSWGFQKERY